MKKLFATALITALFSAAPFSLSAQGSFAPYFGGQILWSIYCTCSGNWLVFIGPPTNAQFVYWQGTQAYESYNMPLIGICALGQYAPGGQCLMYAGTTCTTIGAPQGLITSLTGSSPGTCSPI